MLVTDISGSIGRRRTLLVGVLLLMIVAAAVVLLPRRFPAESRLVEHDGLSYLMCGDGTTGFSRQFEPAQMG